MIQIELFPGYQSAIWKELRRRLPEHYQIPDIEFLGTLHPFLDAAALLDCPASLEPDSETAQESCWGEIMKRVPCQWQMPDCSLLRRMFESN